MKKIIILILFLLLGTNIVYCQSSLLNSTKIWSVRHENSAWHIHPDDPYPFIKTTWYKTGTDTIIENKEYKTLLISQDSLQSNWRKYGAIREEDLKVYYHNYSEEILLYDFDVNIKDTIELVNNHVLFNYVLDSVGIYQTENSDLKIYYFIIFTTYDPEAKVKDTWIEGIGSLFGLLRENCFFTTPCDDSFQLLCLHENNLLIYSNPDFEDCYYQAIYLSSNFSEMVKTVEIFPNPAKNQLTISNPSDIQIKKIELIDFSGRIVQRWKAQELGKNTLNIQQIPHGIYLIKATTEAGITTEKFVIQ